MCYSYYFLIMSFLFYHNFTLNELAMLEITIGFGYEFGNCMYGTLIK